MLVFHPVTKDTQETPPPSNIAKKPHVARNSKENEWYTPSYIIESARNCMGDIDLDPASCHEANKTVRAKQHYTKEENGLSFEWEGRVWLNPPYERKTINAFIAKLLASPKVTQAIVLVNNATETSWGQSLMEGSSIVCFPKKRIRFHNPAKKQSSPLQGQMIAGIGVDRSRFENSFKDIGVIFLKKHHKRLDIHSNDLLNNPQCP